jgi:hypothetical protein
VTSLPLQDSLLAALIGGTASYLIALLVVERLVSPLDVRFALEMACRRLPARLTRASHP